jgi:hypothetical protein
LRVAWNSVERDSVFVNPGLGNGPVTDSIISWRGGSPNFGSLTRRYKIAHYHRMGAAGTDSTVITSNTGVTFNTRSTLTPK